MLNRLHPGHFLVGGLGLLAALLAFRALSLTLAPMPSLPPFSAPVLADRNYLGQFDAFFPSVTGANQSLPVTALPYSLHGIRADFATGRGSAIIATGDGAQAVFAVGDELSDGVKLAAIDRDHVVLERAGAREALWMDAGGDAPVSPLQTNSSEPAIMDSMPEADEAPPSVMPVQPGESTPEQESF